VFCPATELAIGESMQCTGTGSVGDGESYTNVGTAVGTPKWRGDPVSSESTWSAPLSEPIPEPEGPGGPTTPPLLTPPVSDGPPRLPTTGGDSPVFLYAMSGLLLAAGALMVFRRKREERAVNQNRIAEPSSE
jgi:LPXTG-motif cell wall-anchored protein